MRMTPTLFGYLGRQFLGSFLFLFAVLLAVIYLFDTVELLRRAAAKPEITFGFIARLSVLKLPDAGQQIFPFAILFGAMFTFWRLTRRHELVVMRSSGFSVWQFLMPALLGALAIGVVKVTVINPVSAVLLARFETLESQYLKGQDSLVNISENGLWLRQSDGPGYVIVHGANLDAENWVLRRVIVFFFDSNETLRLRIDAQAAALRPGYWELSDAVVNRPQAPPERVALYRLPTELTAQKIEETFSSPATLSFWHIPGFIRTLEETGFSAVRLKIYYQSLLAQPLLFCGMILLAAAVSLRPPRRQGTMTLIASGVIIGFFIFFLDSFLQAFGVSQKLPVLLAAWTPSILVLLLGVAALLHMEDG